MSHLKKYKLLFLTVIFLLVQSLHAVVYFANFDDAKTSISQGDKDAVVKFEARGTFHGVRFKNGSTEVPFGKDDIYSVELYRASSPGNYTPGVDVLIGSAWVTTSDGESDTQQISGFTETQAATTNYVLVYSVSKRAPSGKSAAAVLTNINDGSSWLTTGDNSRDIDITASGLNYGSSSYEALYSKYVTNIGPGMSDIPIMKFSLRAYKYPIVVKSITIRNKDNNFITLAGQENGIKKITLLAATNYGENAYNGIANCLKLVEATLPYGGQANNQLVTLIIPTADRVTIPVATSETDITHDWYFFILYDTGTSLAGVNSSCALFDAEGYESGNPSNAFYLNGTLPFADTQFPVVNATVLLDSYSTACMPAVGALSGQKRVKMLQFKLKTTEKITNATIVIQDEKMMFYDVDEGVNKVSIYRGLTDPVLLGSTSTFESDKKTCNLKGITLDLSPSSGKDYVITYDFGLHAKDPWINPPQSKIIQSSCQLINIKDGNALFASKKPLPEVADPISVTASRVWVTFVSSNASTVKPGDAFQVDIGILNNSQQVDPPLLTEWVYLISDLTRPKFYANNYKGNDISEEYKVTLLYNPSVSLNPGFTYPVTFSYWVEANNLKTNGPVVIDAQVGYRSSDLAAEIIYTRHYRSTSLYPAASTFDENNPVFKYKVINVSDASGKKSIYPSYIDHVEVQKNESSATQGFVNGDIVEENSIMYIYLKNNAPGMELSSLIVKLNGEILDTSDTTAIKITSTNIKIGSIGDSSGTITIDGYSGITKLDTAYINFVMEDGFDARDLLGYPNPYNPDDGDCKIGFYMSEDGKYDIYIYDAAGTQILEEKDLKAVKGYNLYNWSGDRKSGNKVGRGVYLVKVVADGSKKKTITTKIGVK